MKCSPLFLTKNIRLPADLSIKKRASTHEEVFVAPAAEQGLSYPAKLLQRRLVGLERSCLEVTCLLSSTELRSFTEHEEKRLRAGCAMALITLNQTQIELQYHTSLP